MRPETRINTGWWRIAFGTIGDLDSCYAMADEFFPRRIGRTPAETERIWLDDPTAPGGRRLNRDAFVSAGELKQGNLGRNALSGLGMHQIDAALRLFRGQA